MADTARVIWLFACVGYWPYRGVSRVLLLAEFGLIAKHIQYKLKRLSLISEIVRTRPMQTAFNRVAGHRSPLQILRETRLIFVILACKNII